MRRPARREVLAAGAAAFSVVMLDACGVLGSAPKTSPTPSQSPADVQIAQLLAVLEQTLAAGYAAVNSAMLSGTIAAAPATQQLVQLCQAHHSDHIAQWTGALTRVNGAFPQMTDPHLAAQLRAATAAKDEPSAVRALVGLESVVMQTYAQRCGEIVDLGFRHLAASVGPVEAQHLTAYAFLTHDQDVVPAALAEGDLARPGSDVPLS